MKRLTYAAIAAAALPCCATTPETVTVLCDDFEVGADMTGATFGVAPPLDRSYATLAQATSDVAVSAAELSAHLEGACRRLLTGLGELQPPTDPCARAARALDARRPQLRAAGVSVRSSPPRCPIAGAELDACERGCQLDPTCAPDAPETRCAEDERQGTCDDVCLGPCEGTERAPVTCTGRCRGDCVGRCLVADREAEGGGPCDGTCDGTCTATCEPAAPGRCDGVCHGGCAGGLRDASCAGELAPPSCAGDPDCQASCVASATARSVCTSGWLTVDAGPRAREDASLRALVFALEEALPIVFHAARGRGKTLADGASRLVDAAGHLLTQRGDLGPRGAACGIVIGRTAVTAGDNLRETVRAAKAIVSAVE